MELATGLVCHKCGNVFGAMRTAEVVKKLEAVCLICATEAAKGGRRYAQHTRELGNGLPKEELAGAPGRSMHSAATPDGASQSWIDRLGVTR